MGQMALDARGRVIGIQSESHPIERRGQIHQHCKDMCVCLELLVRVCVCGGHSPTSKRRRGCGLQPRATTVSATKRESPPVHSTHTLSLLATAHSRLRVVTTDIGIISCHRHAHRVPCDHPCIRCAHTDISFPSPAISLSLSLSLSHTLSLSPSLQTVLCCDRLVANWHMSHTPPFPLQRAHPSSFSLSLPSLLFSLLPSLPSRRSNTRVYSCLLVS